MEPLIWSALCSLPKATSSKTAPDGSRGGEIDIAEGNSFRLPSTSLTMSAIFQHIVVVYFRRSGSSVRLARGGTAELLVST